MDVGTGLALLGSAKLVEKLLGPTAEYVGDSLKYWTERGARNVGNIFQAATRKLGDRLNEPGTVPAKVLKGIISDGAFCEDQLTAEYFGGVLAASRSGVARDDRGSSLIELINRMSTYQVRTHYVLYAIVRKVFVGAPFNLLEGTGRQAARTFVPFSTYNTAMAFDAVERGRPNVLIPHAIFGLAKEALIENDFAFGPADSLRKRFPGAPADGIVFAPTSIGVDLFMWAHGKGDAIANEFFSPDVILEASPDVKIPAGFLPVTPRFWISAGCSEGGSAPSPA